MNALSLEHLMKGQIQHKFEKELKKVIENILDTDTDYKKKRKIIMKFVFSTNEDRDQTTFDFEIDSKLESIIGNHSRLLIEEEEEGLSLMECPEGTLKGQTYIDEKTGEVFEIGEIKKTL